MHPFNIAQIAEEHALPKSPYLLEDPFVPVIPRYAAPREFAGVRFDDPAFGRPLDFISEVRLPDGIFAELAASIREAVSRV